MKNFDQWNGQKQEIDKRINRKTFREQEIVFVKLGQNVGIESDGKGDIFLRPAVIVKKANAKMAIIVPLTRQLKDEWFQFHFEFKNKKSAAIISQIRLIDSRRILSTIGKMPKNEFNLLKKEIQKMFE